MFSVFSAITTYLIKIYVYELPLSMCRLCKLSLSVGFPAENFHWCGDF